jgi:hypothetical protein
MQASTTIKMMTMPTGKMTATTTADAANQL